MPYDGWGDSTNVYVFNNAAAAFNGRLFLGVSNGAKGAGVWKKTVTAGFTASPTSGRPPLAVSFTNTSGGDFTSSLWDFGDGQTSTAVNPTHTYTAAGAYTVRLTVSDSVDSNTFARPAYVNAWYRAYLPLSLRGYDPPLYDGFDDPAWDGAWNPLLWSSASNPVRRSTAERRDGVSIKSPSPRGGNQITRQPSGEHSQTTAALPGPSQD